MNKNKALKLKYLKWERKKLELEDTIACSEYFETYEEIKMCEEVFKPQILKYLDREIRKLEEE